MILIRGCLSLRLRPGRRPRYSVLRKLRILGWIIFGRREDNSSKSLKYLTSLSRLYQTVWTSVRKNNKNNSANSSGRSRNQWHWCKSTIIKNLTKCSKRSSINADSSNPKRKQNKSRMPKLTTNVDWAWSINQLNSEKLNKVRKWGTLKKYVCFYS